MISSLTGEKSREFGGLWNIFKVEWIKRLVDDFSGMNKT